MNIADKQDAEYITNMIFKKKRIATTEKKNPIR